ncbi:class I SAM-dependent methyltransferase [Hoyosella rhizosphaerae]|uniref:Cyclopropane-fatty-acyl-phospholipid synthase n=1 Tax=Hoyosella rhizosphaerae TaxID=1755582 RepID=A0A916TYT3_9ACTN|nr:cyclopropane-fatty-acyl-phospholipid synthase family protein [Hoyosella rhizosphaerae]MBN4927272.1 class I SAM-dependent methyltransferase [Hoyosella rhizosphaerae]GGC52571.1 cyclopropane-fatty-acyl-phospholipid synthase [Hoyosella rhizosphaerae]
MTATVKETEPAAPTQHGAALTIANVLEPITGSPLPVRIVAWDGSEAGPDGVPVVRITSPDALRRLLWHPGELGAAQAYVTGEIDVDGDLGDALDHVWNVVHERNLKAVRPGPRLLAGIAGAAKKLGVLGLDPEPPESQAKIKGKLHSVRRDRSAISHHYDLSNEFYSKILDPHMAYSCGYWTSHEPGYTVEDAQRDKLDLACRKVGLKPGMRLLDIGCGWGSLSIHAAAEYGARVVGVTISREQKKFADARIAALGLEDTVEIRLQDYREIHDGPFDAVASLEMGEHVGQRNYPRYAEALYKNVRPGGRVLIQQMSRRGRHPGGGPFIESFIAPDMHMRPLGETVEMLEESGLEVRDVHALREHYVYTVDAWYDTFESKWDEVCDLVGEEVARVWRLYLVGGARAFRDGRMGVDQILMVRPDARGASHLEDVRPQWVGERHHG